MEANNALVGYSGFVGQTLLKQTKFDYLYRSTNIEDIVGKKFETVVCAAAPAVKWLANKDPENDKKSIDKLQNYLSTIECKQFILISTVDVFREPSNVTESTLVETTDLHPYGLHRYQLEKFVENNFKNHLIVRLPGLVGPNLKKNIIFDFLNENNLNAIDSRGMFQFYPMVNLWCDIKLALEQKLSLVHLTSEPVSVSEISKNCFNELFENHLSGKPAIYDFKTEYAEIFNNQGCYQYSKKEVMLAIRAYAQSEARKDGN